MCVTDLYSQSNKFTLSKLIKKSESFPIKNQQKFEYFLFWIPSQYKQPEIKSL
jgi:hypothetical protein